MAAVLRDGTVRCTYGEWAAAVSGWSGVASLFCDGFLSAVGADGRPLLQEQDRLVPYDLSAWPACSKVVDGGRGFVAGLTRDGGVVAAAPGAYDREGSAASLGRFSGGAGPRAVDVACGRDPGGTWLLVLCADGTLWYCPFDAMPGFMEPVLRASGVATEPGADACRGAACFDGVLSDGSWAAVRADGSVWWSGSRLWGWEGAVAAAAGVGFCAALFADGTVRTTAGGPDTSGWRLW